MLLTTLILVESNIVCQPWTSFSPNQHHTEITPILIAMEDMKTVLHVWHQEEGPTSHLMGQFLDIKFDVGTLSYSLVKRVPEDVFLIQPTCDWTEHSLEMYSPCSKDAVIPFVSYSGGFGAVIIDSSGKNNHLPLSFLCARVATRPLQCVPPFFSCRRPIVLWLTRRTPNIET